jgi:hypothetical protein
MSKKRSDPRRDWRGGLLVAAILLLVPTGSLAAEKYTLFVNNNIKVAGVSAEVTAGIEQAVLDVLANRAEFKLVKNDDLQSLIALYSKSEQVDEQQLVETVRFAGIDYLLLIYIAGEIRPTNDKLEQLFEQNNARPLSLNVKLLDLPRGKTVLELAGGRDNLSAVKAEITRELADFKLDGRRGKIVGLSGSQIKIDLGQKDGVTPGVKVPVFRAKEIKAGKLALSVPAEKIGEAIIANVDQDWSLASVGEGAEATAGDYVELTMAKTGPEVLRLAGQGNQVVVGQADGGFVVVPAQKQFASAESRFKEFAKKAEEARMQSAMYGVGLGLLYFSLGSASSSSYYGSKYSSVYYGLGAGLTILGASSFFFPSELENSYNKIKQMPSLTVEERGAREAFAESSLKKGAESAQQGRVIASGLLVGIGLVSGSSGVGLLYCGIGAMSYFMKSDIEKTYEEYMKDKDEFIRAQHSMRQ